MRTLLRTLAIGSLILAGTAVGPLSAGAQSSVAAAVPTCQASTLSIAPDLSSGATGHIAAEMRLLNISTQPCTMKGFATLVLLDGSRRPLPTVLSWGSRYFTIFNRPVRLVTVPPHGSAYLALGWSHIPEPGQSCPKAPNLLILPPGASTALLLPMGQPNPHSYGPIDACGGALAVSPVEPTHFSL